MKGVLYSKSNKVTSTSKKTKRRRHQIQKLKIPIISVMDSTNARKCAKRKQKTDNASEKPSQKTKPLTEEEKDERLMKWKEKFLNDQKSVKMKSMEEIASIPVSRPAPNLPGKELFFGNTAAALSLPTTTSDKNGEMDEGDD